MIIIGERINSSRKIISEAIKRFDKEIIINETKIQISNSLVNMLDVNCGTEIKNEPEIMKWLVEIVQSITNLPLVIDSPNPIAIESALKVCKNVGFINSITAEDERIESILPLAKQYNTKLIALTIDKDTVPSTAEERVKIVEKIVNKTTKFGFDIKNLYIDPLVKPVSVEKSQVKEVLNTIKILKNLGLKTVVAISNVSFGLPKRWYINRVFLSLCIWYGVDALFLDPVDKELALYLKITKMLSAEDEFCLSYLNFIREHFG